MHAVYSHKKSLVRRESSEVEAATNDLPNFISVLLDNSLVCTSVIIKILSLIRSRKECNWAIQLF